jgi:hypothetical protein
MSESTYLVFGDLHGRVLPAFCLGLAWAREHAVRVTGLLQVGDLGYFPDPSNLDKATRRHAERDPLELGTTLVTVRNPQATAILEADDVPEGMWFTQGNHEDSAALDECERAGGSWADAFAVDAYARVFCVGDGRVATLPGGLRVGALWGIDNQAPNARRKLPPRAYLRPRKANALAAAAFDVLLTHESPRDAVRPGSGSTDIDAVIGLARPALAFFGHYGRVAGRVEGDFRDTRVYHLSGFELRGPGGSAEDGSVGVLRWADGRGTFDYLPSPWLRTFTRHNWQTR